MEKRSTLFACTIALFALIPMRGGAEGEGYQAGHRVRYIDTPRQFSIDGVTELTKVVIGVHKEGREITISESNFEWDRRLEELLKQSVGQPPKHGNLRYDPTWDRIEVFSDEEYFNRVMKLLRTQFPDTFAKSKTTEQAGSGKPATRPESKLEGSQKPQH